MQIPQQCLIDTSVDKLELKKISKVIPQLVEFVKLGDVNYSRATPGKYEQIYLSPPVRKQTLIDFEEFSQSPSKMVYQTYLT